MHNSFRVPAIACAPVGVIVVGCVELSWIDCDLDCSIMPEVVIVCSMTFREPMANSSPDLTDKVEAALLSQMSEIADQIRDNMLVIRAAASLKYRDGLSGPGSVVARIGHALSSTMSSSLRKSMRFDVVLDCHGHSDYGTSL